MKIIVSPAKTMRIRVEACTTPYFIDKAMEIRGFLRGLDRESLSKIWKCNDKLIDQNIKLLENDARFNLTRAIYAYDGLQFKNLEVESLGSSAIDFLNEHLYILSAVYGALRPMDGVIPYRLEMQAMVNYNGFKTMYDYWGSTIYDYITRDDNIIINLASKEYSDSIIPYINGDVKLINISFGSLKDNRLIIKSTESKILRGRFLRFIAENKINNVEDLKGFNYDGFSYNSYDYSTNTMLFIR